MDRKGQPTMSRTGNRGFTLVEVMITVAVLALGAVLIYEAFFILLDAFNYYSDYLDVVSWADEKVWEAQNGLACYGSAAMIETDGTYATKGGKFKWRVSVDGTDQGFYKVSLRLFGEQGKRKVNISRATHAMYVERQQ